jgi:hypothetical protein
MVVPFVRYNHAPNPELPKANNTMLPHHQLPIYAVIAFGAYLFLRLVYGVLTFNDVPEAHQELLVQIEQAKNELRAKGVDVD